MKKYWLISLLLPILMLWGCSEDTSAYLPQEKEDVLVDDVKPESGENEDADEVLPEGQLVIGMHQVKLNVPVGDSIYERKFKYYLPITVDQTQPISLIFDFHGSWDYKLSEGEAPNPIANISTSHPLVQHAIKNNCIVCFPAGTPEHSEGSEEGAVNWQFFEKHLPFVDAMIEYFKGCTPTVDANRIYSTGQSSGAIFSFVLAFERSEVFAAITPRAGQMNISKQDHFPTRAVPIRVFAGQIDKTVSHSGVVANMTEWAEKIGGYFPSDMVLTEDSIEIENYKKVDTRIWKGGNADLQIYSLQDEGHGISEYYCMPYMWEFMSAHTLDSDSDHLFVTSNLKEFEVNCGQSIKIKYNYSEGAEVSIENAPKGWTMIPGEKEFTLVAPKDFFANINRRGTIDIRVQKGDASKTLSIAYNLLAPKEYFEVGDIYYDENFVPVGVVCWVNDANIKEAKIIELTGPLGRYKDIYFCGGFRSAGLGSAFETPDRQDGEGNTAAMVKRNIEGKLRFTAKDAAFMWAHSYVYKYVRDWYLPAIDECLEIGKNVDIINNVLKSLNAEEIDVTRDIYSSTTVMDKEKDQKVIYIYDFKQKKELHFYPLDGGKNGKEYYGFHNVRAIKKVTK